jgi:hypothetical protein
LLKKVPSKSASAKKPKIAETDSIVAQDPALHEGAPAPTEAAVEPALEIVALAEAAPEPVAPSPGDELAFTDIEHEPEEEIEATAAPAPIEEDGPRHARAAGHGQGGEFR